MAEQSRSFKKKKHFLKLIEGIPCERILFAPIDVSKDFHVTLFHNIDCQPLCAPLWHSPDSSSLLHRPLLADYSCSVFFHVSRVPL